MADETIPGSELEAGLDISEERALLEDREATRQAVLVRSTFRSPAEERKAAA